MNAKAAIRRTAAGIAAAFISAATVLTPLPEYVPLPLTAEAATLFAGGYEVDGTTVTIFGTINYEKVSAGANQKPLKIYPGNNTWDDEIKPGKTDYIIKSPVDLPANCSRLFYNYSDLRTVVFMDGVDADGVNDISYMFKECPNLRNIDLSGLINYNDIQSFEGMFSGCKKLEIVTIPSELLDSLVINSGQNIKSVLSSLMNGCNCNKASDIKSSLETQYNEYINKPLITDCTITAPSKEYDGTPPNITVTYGDTTLEENTDYTVTFSQDGTVIDPPVNAGTYQFTITGKGNYRGSETLDVTIDAVQGASLLKKNTVSFKDSISLNFLAEIDDDKADGAYVKFTYDHYGQTEVKIVTLNRSDKNGKYFRFRCPLTASEMTVNVTAELFIAGVDKPVDTWTRNIRDYCLTGLEQSSNELEKTLFRAALNYGGYTQLYFKRNTGMTANAEIEESMSEVTVISDITFDKPSSATAGIRYIGSSLLLKDAPYVRYYFEPDTGIDINDYTFTLRQNETDTVSTIQYNDNGYYIESVSELACQLDVPQTVKVTKNGVSVFSFNYSVIKWAQIASEDPEAGTDEVNMARGLYKYYLAAKAFVDSNRN